MNSPATLSTPAPGSLAPSSFSIFGKRLESIRSYGDQLAGRSRNLQASHVSHAPEGRKLLRYRWADTASAHVYRVGIFAGIHGDEESGILAVMQFLHHLERDPEIAEFYELFLLGDSRRDGVKGSRAGISTDASGPMEHAERNLKYSCWSRTFRPSALTASLLSTRMIQAKGSTATLTGAR